MELLMRFKTMAFAAAVSLAAPVFAQSATDAPAPKPAKEKKICRRGGPATGSILSAPAICHTKSEWDRIDSDNARIAGDAMQRSQTLQNNGQVVRQ
jgi:hypothetical protein